MNDGILSRYWRAYGGITALFKSPYLWLSVVITIFLFPHWSKPEWWDDVLSIMPNLLGFSLGGYAMWIAIGDDDFRKLISGEDEDGKPSPYMEVNAAFVHFVVLQMLSMIFALFAKAYFFELPQNHFLLNTLGEWFGILCLGGYFIVTAHIPLARQPFQIKESELELLYTPAPCISQTHFLAL